MNNEWITIAKKPGKKDCLRIQNENDIPDFLKDAIKVEDNILVLDCLEGEERTPFGSVIAYEKLENGKMNVWVKDNWKETTKEVDGVFYELAKPNKALKVTDSLPEELVDALGGKLTTLEDGTFQLEVDWGVAKCAPYQGYFIIYGKKEDGSLDANFLEKSTPSFSQYYVLDGNGDFIQTLEEYDDQYENNSSFHK